MRVQHNIAALNSYRNYSNNTGTVGKNLEKLSSGYKINRAGDDAAGLAISEKMRAQITGLETAQKNASDGVSLVQTAEGALTEIHSMLNRMVELADQSANGTYKDDVDRENLQEEITALQSEIDRIADATNFNGINLLDGTMGIKGANVEGTYTNQANKTSNLKFSAGGLSEKFDDATVGQVELKAKVAADAGAIEVTISDAGKITVQLGAKQAAKYTASDIQKAVRDEIKKMSNGTEAQKKVAAGLKGFKVSGDAIELAAGDTGAGMTAKNFAAGSDESLKLQIGDTSAEFNQLKVGVSDMHIAALGVDSVDVSSQAGAQAAIDVLKDAINEVSSTRGKLGAAQNRLEHTINNLSVTTENMTAAESRVRDVDVAKEMMSYTKNNILVQSAQAMLAQANQTPQGVLQLLQ